MKKKAVTILLAAVLAMQLAACGGNTSTTGASASPEASSEEDAEDAAEEDAGVEEEDAEDAEEITEEITSAGEDTGTHTVTDHGGNIVEVPNEITRVVIDQIPILSTYMAYFGGETPYLVGFAGSFKDIISRTVLKNIAPELYESSDTVYAQSDLNIEEIIKLNPDVIFYNAQNEQHAEILKGSGIPAVGFATVGASTPADPVERYEEWLNLLEDVFGEEGKTDAFVAAGDVIVEEVAERIATVPEEDRPSAMILWKYNDGVPQVSGKGTFGTFWLQRLGVKDVVAEEAQGFAQVDLEQVYAWDPDILFLDGPGLLSMTVDDVLENRVDGIDFTMMKAAQEERVYNTTLGMWNWFTPNPDAPLVYAWLACNTYPDAFADYSLEDTIREYYKTWYGYEPADDEIAEMLRY